MKLVKISKEELNAIDRYLNESPCHWGDIKIMRGLLERINKKMKRKRENERNEC